MMLSMLQTGMRPREARIPVMIASRMRAGGRWCDVRIHNISSRGMLLAGEDAPAVGTYVEIRRGTQIIIGRVMWAKDRYFGLRSQEKLPIQAIISEPRLASRPHVARADAAQDAGQTAERRSGSRLAAENRAAHQAERSRALASMIQYGALACAGLGVAGWAAGAVYGLLSAPAQQIGRVLGG